jgi:small-conductance mechanosensitive channel
MDPVLRLLQQELFKLSGKPVTSLSLFIFFIGLSLTLVVATTLRALVAAYVRRRGNPPGLGYALGRIVQYGTVASGTFVCLDTLGVNMSTLAAFGAVISVGVGFGLQNVAQNFIAGIILLIERPIQQGDFVVVGDVVGTVTEIEMRATKIVTRDGVAMIVPNSEFVSGRVLNQSHPTTRKRVHVYVGVAYGSDTALVRDTLAEIALAHPHVLHDPEPVVLLRNFGDSSLDFDLAVWLDAPDAEPLILSDLRFAIDRVFRERGISIPFPQREVRVLQAETEARASLAYPRT